MKNSKNQKSKNKAVKNSGKILGIIIYILLIVLVSLVSFLGVFVKSKNTTANQVKDFKLGYDIDKVRSIVIKVAEQETEEELVEEDTEEEEAEAEEETTSEETVTEEVNNYDDFIKSKKIIEDRIKLLKLDYYEVKCDESNGTIKIEVPDGETADYIAQYSVTKGVFNISDNSTEEVLLDNNQVEKSSVAYYTSTSGTSVYLTIKFNKEGKEKLKEISNIYRETEEDATETTDATESSDETASDSDEATAAEEKKEIKMTLDDQTILVSSFDEEIDTGEIQLTLGTSSDSKELQDYLRQASNISVFLNTDPLPIDYEMSANKVVYSEISEAKLQLIIYVLAGLFALTLIFMIIKYKATGLLGAVASIGYLAILLLLIRYTNVLLTLSGIFGVFISAVLESLLLSKIIGAYKKDLDKETKRKLINQMYFKGLEIVIPILIIAIIFTLFNWQIIDSLGMVLFYGVIEILIWNLINIKIICRKEGK